jgi:aryl-phospho-beta-D-glucosidase BglC (GH1 family)
MQEKKRRNGNSDLCIHCFQFFIFITFANNKIYLFMKKLIVLSLCFIISFNSENLFSQERAFEMNKRLGMGINLGNLFEAPSIGEWGVEPDSDHFKEIKSKGFASLRLPAKWSAHAMKTSPYTIDRDFMDTIKWAVDLALANQLPVIINIHHYDEMINNPAAHKERFLALWNQISTQFQHYSDSLYFEILNEPNGNFTPAIWNNYLVEGLSKIREKNPTRMVIIGTAEWGGIGGLSQLRLPDDPNIILTIHYYEPFNFTHQGADWTGQNLPIGVTWDSTAVQINAIKRDMDVIKQYSQKNNVPVYIGEFGAIGNADDASRARWMGHLKNTFKEYGFSGAYWEFCSGFGIYDAALNCYRTGMLRALTGFEGTVCDCSMYDTVIVKNNTFDKSIQPWYFQRFPEYGAEAKIGVVNGEARIEIISNGKEAWHIQFLYPSFPLIKGNTYTLLFDAYASSPTTIASMINRDGGDYAAAYYMDANLTTEKKTFSFTFTYTGETMNKARIAFDLGLAKAQYIYFDNIYLYEKAPSSKNEIVSSKCTVKIGENKYAVEGNTIKAILIYDISGRIYYWKTYQQTNFVEIKENLLPPNIGLIQVQTDVKKVVLKNVNKVL